VRPYSTCEVPGSSVVQAIVAVSGPMEDTVTAESTGGVRSLATVTVTAAEVVFPAASRATAVRVYEPLLTAVVSQEREYVLVVSSGPRFAMSSLNCTPTTPTLSEAVAETVIVPVTMSPVVGEAIDTVGGVVSTGAAPVPARLTGERLAAALMLRVPVALPASAGAKTTNRSQCVPGAMTPFQLALARQ